MSVPGWRETLATEAFWGTIVAVACSTAIDAFFWRSALLGISAAGLAVMWWCDAVRH